MKEKKIMLIKIPAKIKNRDNAIQLLGGKKNILKKFYENENLDLKIMNYNLPLEKCICNDILIKRKTLRNKKDSNLIKYKYEIIGNINFLYDYFIISDFIYLNRANNSSINELKNICIDENDYLNELNNNKELDKNNAIEKNQIEKNNIAIHNLIEKNCKTNINKNYSDINNILELFQPNQFSSLRYSYPKNFKKFFSKIED